MNCQPERFLDRNGADTAGNNTDSNKLSNETAESITDARPIANTDADARSAAADAYSDAH